MSSDFNGAGWTVTVVLYSLDVGRKRNVLDYA